MTMSMLTLAAAAACGLLPAPQEPTAADVQTALHAPVMLRGGGEAVRVESPGYAAPCWTDIDGDGDGDLLVGQFRDGKIRVFASDGDGKLAAGRWLEAEGDVAQVPGVW
jgi:hypothetical protein